MKKETNIHHTFSAEFNDFDCKTRYSCGGSAGKYTGHKTGNLVSLLAGKSWANHLIF
jgi:hypothetical protein